MLSYYGIEVCPFIATLDGSTTFINIFINIIALYLIRYKLLIWFENTTSNHINSNLYRLFYYEMLLWLGCAFSISAIHSIFFGFPIGSHAKVFVGLASYGIFSSINTVLFVNRSRILHIAASPFAKSETSKQYVSLVTKFIIFIAVCLLLIGILITLLFQNNFVFNVDYKSTNAISDYAAIGEHVLFVFSTIFAGILWVSFNFSRNLKLILKIELSSLEKILEGDYSTRVPVLTHDEFRLFADATNTIVTDLESKEQQVKSLGHLVNIDSLTGLYNRSFLNQKLQSIDGFREYSRAYIMIDVDFLKQINDKYGHSAGDHTIIHIAKILQQQVSGDSVLARISGDEFSIIITDISYSDAQMIAEKITQEIDQQPLIFDSQRANISVSVGLAFCEPDKDISVTTLAKNADNCLYKAKSAGRNSAYHMKI